MTSHTTTGHTTGRTGDPSGGWTGQARGEPADGWTGQAGTGRVDAVVAGAARVSDALMEVGEALVAALAGAVTGAARTAAGIWVADRPRRQRERTWRRRRWLARRGWWRAAVILELVGVGAWMGGRAAVRAVRGVPAGAAQGARTGWESGRGRAQERRGTRRGAPVDDGPAPAWDAPGPAPAPTPTPTPTPGPGPVPGASTSTASSGPGGEQIVDAEILCGRSGCDTVLAGDDPGPLCPACTAAQATVGDDVQVTVEVTSPTDPPTRPAAEPAAGAAAESMPTAGPVVSPDPGEPDPENLDLVDQYLDLVRRRNVTAWERIRSSARPGDPCRLPDGRTGSVHTVTSDAIRVQIDRGPLVWLSPQATDDTDGAAARSAPQFPAGHPAGGSDQSGALPGGSTHQHDHEHDDQEDGMDTTTDNDELTITSGPGGSAVQGGTRMGGQLTSVGDLAAETQAQKKYAEVGLRMLQDLEGWAAGLADQIAGADWSTEGVTQAAVGLAEASTVQEVRSGITVLTQELGKAQQLGEALAAGGARKSVGGLRPQ